MSKKTRTRILTIRGFPNPADYEAIEKDDKGFFFWIAQEGTTFASFPVDIEFVKSEFKKQGREFKE